MRNYEAMREILFKVSMEREVALMDMKSLIKNDLNSREDIVQEIERLKDEGLIISDMQFDNSGALNAGTIKGLTNEGVEFLRFIENPDVWEICAKTLNDAKVDLSYPFLKEVCEEIVKRYVMSKIPDSF